MKLPVIDIVYNTNNYIGYCYKYNSTAPLTSKDSIETVIDYIKKKYKLTKYITILSNCCYLPKDIYIDDIKVDFRIMVHGKIHILHNHIKYILIGNKINPYRCISYEIICPDVEERVDYLKDNGMFTNLKKFICNKS